MEFKGTKGEWAVSPNAVGFIADISDNFAIAKAFDNAFIQKGEMEANAKLIACAPELLEVLVKCINYLPIIEYSELIKEAKYLIKKATTI
jgi:hypothetical protein